MVNRLCGGQSGGGSSLNMSNAKHCFKNTENGEKYMTAERSEFANSGNTGNISIAIDGPAGAGKSTIAKEISKRLSITYVDTGAMYRAIGLKAMRMGIDPADVRRVVPMLDGTNVSIEYIDGVQHVLLDGEDVSGLIRTEEVSHYASVISTIPEVRKSLWNCSVRLQGFAMSLWTGAIYVPMFCPMQRISFCYCRAGSSRSAPLC